MRFKLFSGFGDVALVVEFDLKWLAVFHGRSCPDAIFALCQSSNLGIPLAFNSLLSLTLSEAIFARNGGCRILGIWASRWQVFAYPSPASSPPAHKLPKEWKVRPAQVQYVSWCLLFTIGFPINWAKTTRPCAQSSGFLGKSMGYIFLFRGNLYGSSRGDAVVRPSSSK